jgi:hypothetical protein
MLRSSRRACVEIRCMALQHIVLVDIDPEHEAAFNAWYDEVHIPDILGCPGWLSATRYRCLEGGPRYAAVYEITGSVRSRTMCAISGACGFNPCRKRPWPAEREAAIARGTPVS